MTSICFRLLMSVASISAGAVLPPNEGASPPALLVERNKMAQYEQNHSLQPYVA